MHADTENSSGFASGLRPLSVPAACTTGREGSWATKQTEGSEVRMPIKLFVSHISEEGDIAALLKETMQKDFFGLVEFFTSSDIGSISAVEDWLSAVQHAMDEATAVLVLCS